LRTHGPYHRHKSTKSVASYTSAHITETVFAHDQHWEEQSTLSSPQLYHLSQEHRKWITTQQRITQPMLVRIYNVINKIYCQKTAGPPKRGVPSNCYICYYC